MVSVKVLLVLVASLTYTLAAESACPTTDFIDDAELAQVTEKENADEAKIAQQAEGSVARLPSFGVQSRETCAEPAPSTAEASVCLKNLALPTSDAEEDTSRSKRQVSFVKRCDACPAYQRFLRRHGRCYVLWWSVQQARTVVCPQRPWYNQVCDCGNPLQYRQICVRTHWIRVWFWSWCPFGSSLPWGYHGGLNYNYRWLPQDCQCRCYRRNRC